MKTTITILTLLLFAACAKPSVSISGPAIRYLDVTSPENPDSLTVHYHRYDGDYAGWNLWVWPTDPNGDGKGYPFGAPDSEGFVTAHIVVPDSIKEFGVIVRKSEDGNEWAEKDVDTDRFTREKEIWLVQNDPVVYAHKPEETTESIILFAAADSAQSVNLSLITPPADYSTFALYQGDRNIVGTSERGKDALHVTVHVNETIDVTKGYKIVDQSGTFGEKSVTMREILNAFYYSGNDLGLNYGRSGSTFKLWSPTAVQVSVVLYDDAGSYNAAGRVTDTTSTQLYAMQKDSSTGLWSATVPGNLDGKFYLYRVAFADGQVNFAADPYAKAVSANGQRMAIIDLEQTNPAGFTHTKPPFSGFPQDAVIYEIHARDFSVDPDSGITHKGKFLAFTETGTKTSAGLSTGIDYLNNLGISHVHLLPSFDFASVNERDNSPQFNWGYDPQHYNVPEGSYATDPNDPAVRIREFKQMVQSLHDAKIRVVMDVVYNHTFATGGAPFDAVVPGYYYRTTDTGSYSNGSACGNETASERPMVRKFIVDSVLYWAREYGVDGFRFDLMGLHDIETMNAVRAALDSVDPSIIVYGEGWTAGTSPLPEADRAVKANAAKMNERIAVFSDDIRDGIKGSVFASDDRGFVNAGTKVESVKFGITASVQHPDTTIKPWAASPSQTVTYASAHDNLSLWDKLKAASPAASDAELIQMNKLSAAIVLSSQGIPFFQAGEELARTKQGNENSYNAPDSINRIEWARQGQFPELVAYYQGLISLRNRYPAFRLKSAQAIQARLHFLTTKADDALIVYTLESDPDSDYRSFVVIFNANPEAKTVTIPAGSWDILVNGDRAGTNVLSQYSGSEIKVDGKTAMVLAGR
ncbi:type I pullulanase [Spirochaetia bacterium]|nr:type I pullulanase [Spirochaetia bacterium]